MRLRNQKHASNITKRGMVPSSSAFESIALAMRYDAEIVAPEPLLLVGHARLAVGRRLGHGRHRRAGLWRDASGAG